MTRKNKSRVSRKLLLMLGFLLFSINSYAALSVNGIVNDTNGEPIIGASVLVKGTPNGVATDYDGKFSIQNVDGKSILIVSYVGCKTQEVALQDRSQLVIVLESVNKALDEIVVVGYGSLSKKELSSSIVQVDKSQFVQGSMNNPMEMLTGKVAGLNVNNQASANPNSSSSLQVRGATSISASNSPLVVIDGIAGGDIRNVAAQDIESMTILKDAASASIYGTRGANGVILITTKKGGGEAGNTIVTYDSYVGMNIAKPHADILSPEEFRRSRRGTDYGYNTDWYDLITNKSAFDHNQYLSIDGTTKNGYYGASFNYKHADGLDIRSSREEFGGRLVVQQKVIDNRLQINGGLSARRVNEEWGNEGMFDTALNMNPTMPVTNADGSYYQPISPTGALNPVSVLKDIDNNGQRLYLLGNLDAQFTILRSEKHNLNTSISYSLQYNDMKQHYFTPSTSGESYWNGYKGRAEVKYQKWYTNRLEWLGNYMFSSGDHNVKAVVGYSYERSSWEQLAASNNNFAYDNTKWYDLGSGSFLSDGKANMYTGQSESTLIGFFGRVNYNWKNLLMASASLRYEGSTKFGKDNKWGAFPAVSVAWEMANMDFLKPFSNVVSSLKPRISYGVTGRSDFDAYQSLATYSANGSYFMNGQWIQGYAPSVNANPNLAWEKSKSTNIGVDFVLLNNRLRGSVEWFDRRSEDLLYKYIAPQPPFVYPSILVNVGTTKNTGVEISLNGDILTSTPLKWTMGANYTYGKTILSKLSNDIYKASFLELYLKPGVGTSEYFFRVEEGGEIGQFYGYEFAGVKDGKMLIYTDKNEKVPVSEADVKYKRHIGNGTPQHFLSWSNMLTYKNFDLNIMFTGAFGFDIFNMRKYGMGLQGCGTDNVLRSAYLDDKDMVTGGGVISSYFLENGNYLKLDNLTVGYNFYPKNKKILESLRLYVTAKNLFTLTAYKGNDPSIVNVNGITPGVDISSAYPTATQLSLGVTVRFK